MCGGGYAPPEAFLLILFGAAPPIQGIAPRELKLRRKVRDLPHIRRQSRFSTHYASLITFSFLIPLVATRMHFQINQSRKRKRHDH